MKQDCNTLQHKMWHCITQCDLTTHCNTHCDTATHCNTHCDTTTHTLQQDCTNLPYLWYSKNIHTHTWNVYIYTYAYTHIHIHGHAYKYSTGLHELVIPLILKHMHTHVYVNVYACIHIYIPIYIYISTYKYALKIASTILLNPWLIPKYIHTHKSMYVYTDTYIYTYPPDPMNHAKIFEGWSPRDAPSELVPQWNKTFPPDHFGRVEMKNPTTFSNNTSTAWSCAEDQILENKISGTGF